MDLKERDRTPSGTNASDEPKKSGKNEKDAAAELLPFVPFPSPLTPVRVVRRANRFVVEAEDDAGQRWPLHLPNSGRMRELLTPGASGLAHFHGISCRRTAGTLLLVRYAGRWVSVDAHMPNRLFDRGLVCGALAPFRPFVRWRSEAAVAGVRLDFLLEAGDRSEETDGVCYVETKSCNLVEGGIALFPDAPTGRGTRHVEVLASLVRKGNRAAVVWFVQRDDARCLRPHRKADPAFANALAHAVAEGVEVYAYRCRVTPEGIAVLGTIPVQL
jgi:sugar fermentation stimulation protein A